MPEPWKNKSGFPSEPKQRDDKESLSKADGGWFRLILVLALFFGAMVVMPRIATRACLQRLDPE